MLLTRFERAERLRAHVQSDDLIRSPQALADSAAGDAGALQTAWTSFVPLLAHPVMNGSASAAMEALDAAASMLVNRSLAAA